MNAHWKEEWDFLGWMTRGMSGAFTQKDWTQTLITRMNQLSAQIFRVSQRGGANQMLIHPTLFEKTVKELEYTRQEDDGSYTLSGRYKIKMFDSLPLDKIYMVHAGYPMLPAINTYEGITYVRLHSESHHLPEFKAKAEHNSSLIINVVDADKLVGEITVTNI